MGIDQGYWRLGGGGLSLNRTTMLRSEEQTENQRLVHGDTKKAVGWGLEGEIGLTVTLGTVRYLTLTTVSI